MPADAHALSLLAPFDGWCTSLDDAPDPVFAGRMLGDGFAIDPTGAVVHAPCDGEVVVLPATRHAVTLRTTSGMEVLIHVGIDTVGLHGAGFEALVDVGATVRAGDPLLRLDLDALAGRARSLLTPVVVLGDDYRVEPSVRGATVRAGDAVATVVRRANDTAAGDARDARVDPLARAVMVGLAHGLHARPAARIAQAARASAVRVTLTHGGTVADAGSVTALMKLGVRRGDAVTVHVEGGDGVRVLDEITAILATPEPAAAPSTVARAPLARGADTTVPHATSGNVVRAVVASRGLALGPARHLRAATYDVPVAGQGAIHEATALRDALRAVRTELARRGQLPDLTQRELAAAHALLLDDPALTHAADREIEHGHSAGHAWRVAMEAQVRSFETLADPYLRERAADLRDLEAQVLVALGLARAGGDTAFPDGSIVLAEDVLPSQFASLDPLRLGGLCTSSGGPTSHVAILAGSVGLPMLVAAGPALRDIGDGTVVLLDAHTGALHVEPDAVVRAVAAERIAEQHARRERERAAAHDEGRSADGVRVHVYANLGAPGDATQAVALGAEGCGLLRSEFLFLDRHTAPSEDEQLAVYQATATGLEGRTLTVRTLDVGGDKPLDYLPMPPEDNPALGLRGVRTSLHMPELLREQLRAVLRVRPAGQCRLLLPMITDADEVLAVRAELAACGAELGVAELPALGVMIETPAAAVLVDTLAPHVEFFSIGTNDLTQYTLAMDRTHPLLASRLDGLHPSVLRLIASVCDAARAHDREVGVCGSLAMDDAAIPVLLGLGVHELSVAHAAVPAVKARVATLDVAACRGLAQRAIALPTAAQVRQLLATALSTEPSDLTTTGREP